MALAVLALGSCSKPDDGNIKIQYIPYQESKSGDWGMVSMADGSVLFSEEFKHQPTAVVEDRFMVQDNEGMWEIYTATEHPDKVGGKYVGVTCFYNGVAFAVERSKPVTMIDTDGNTIKTLDKVNGKVVDGVYEFSEGYAIYKTGDLYGVIDQQGNSVIKADYVNILPCSDGKFLAIEKKYQKEVKESNEEKINYVVLDTNGKKVLELKGGKYCYLMTGFKDGMLGVAVKKDGKQAWGIINDKGETVVKPSSKLEEIQDIQGEEFIFKNGDSYGLMNLQGETLIRAKYAGLHFDGDNLLAISDKKGDIECKVIDHEDNQVSEEKYEAMAPYKIFDGSNTIAQESDDNFIIIDANGKELDKQPDMVNVNLVHGFNFVESDFVDINALINSLHLSTNGIDGLTLDMQPLAAINKVRENDSTSYYSTSASDYEYSSSLSYYHNIDGEAVHIEADFPGSLSRETYRTQRVIDYEDYYYTYYHDEQIPTGYTFNNVTPSTITATFDHDGKLRGKLNDLFKALQTKLQAMGQIEKKNNGAFIVAFNDGHKVFVFKTPSSVKAIWGSSERLSDIDISQYEDVSEDLKMVEYNYDDIDAVDSTTCDSTVALWEDSCAVDSAK